MEKLVETTEALCDAFEKLPSSITDRLIIERFTSESLNLSVAATVANIRMFYYIVKNNYPKESTLRGFEQLRWLLTESKSGWDELNDDERIALFKQSRDLYNEVFVFV